MSKQTPLEGKWKDSKDIGQGGGRACFDLRLGDQTNVIRIFCLLCVVMALLLSIMISGLYEGSLANLGEIEVFQVQVQGKRKAHLGHLCKGVCS